jgi:hypothetical protein
LGNDPLGSAVIDLIEQAERQEMIDALKMTNKSEDSNPSPKKKLFPSTKKGKFFEKTVRTTDKKSNKYCLIHSHNARTIPTNVPCVVEEPVWKNESNL